MDNLHEIKLRSPRPNVSLTLPATAAGKGLAFQESDTPGTAELADGTRPIVGFLTRDSKSAADLNSWILKNAALGGTHIGGIESPFEVSKPGSFEDAQEFEAEGAGLIDNVDANTALGTLCSFNAGKISVATAGELAEFVLVEKGMTPVTAGNFRARFQRLNAHVIAGS